MIAHPAIIVGPGGVGSIGARHKMDEFAVTSEFKLSRVELWFVRRSTSIESDLNTMGMSSDSISTQKSFAVSNRMAQFAPTTSQILLCMAGLPTWITSMLNKITCVYSVCGYSELSEPPYDKHDCYLFIYVKYCKHIPDIMIQPNRTPNFARLGSTRWHRGIVKLEYL